ncbi:Long-chain fatty acid transport protein 4 [Orchesella cincta]|uniref:Long-chain-fatty-acid--CoA ligase n=1 Tax=Orchesella cincta TaxID=48709 RepID=A0A1D2M5T5_ORCCI|nr:Long-chain fatty acid transport protein 4 [Orchesella cincta]
MDLANIPILEILKYFIIFRILLFLWGKRDVLLIVFKTFPRDMRLLYTMYGKILFGWIGRRRRNETISKSLDIMTSKGPDRVCYYFGDEVWTFRQLQRLSFRVANHFKAKGFKKGDTVGLSMTNRPEMTAIWIGLGRLGVVTFLINTSLRGDSLEQSVFSVVTCKAYIIGRRKDLEKSEIYELDRFMENSESNLVHKKQLDIDALDFPTTDLANCLQKAGTHPTILKDDEQPNFLDPLLYVCTSGTTGIPKAVRCSHGRLTFLASAASVLNLNENDVTYSAGPMYHLSGILGAAWAVVYGAPNVMVMKFSASNFWQEVKRHNVTICLYIGEFLRFLCNQPVVNPEEEKRHKIRGMFGGGGMRPETWAKFQERFDVKEFADLYGSTEGNCTLLNLERKPGACGYIPIWMQPIHPIQLIRIDQITGEIIRDKKTGLAIKCKDDEPGELIGKIIDAIPMSRFDGYTDPVATEKRIAHNVFKAGDKYFRSGDCLARDKYGYYYFQDRIGDTFRWKAENVATTMVESVISRLTGLRNNVVYGVKVPGTEGSCGMLSILDLLDGQLDLISLAEGMQTSLPFYAIPMFIRLVNPRGNGLDMTGTFKFQKFRLRQDGFDIEKVEDPIFIYSTLTKTYRKLDLSTYKEVMKGNYRF